MDECEAVEMLVCSALAESECAGLGLGEDSERVLGMC